MSVEARALTKRYGNNQVLRGVDLTVRQGEIFALLGPNGAGKTTTVRMLATLTTPDSGTAVVAGADVVSERATVRRRIALTGQYAALDGQQTGRQNLQMMARLSRLPRSAARTRADQLLERFDLIAAADRRVETYSGGMRRRLDLAVSLVAQPQVIFLDEPTTGLDPRSRSEVWSVVAELAHGGTTVFLTTQYLEEADRLADQVAVVDHGTIVARGTVDELKRQVGVHRIDLVARDETAYRTLLARVGDSAGDAQTRTLNLAVDDDARAVRALLDHLDPDSELVGRFSVHRASLDDVFLSLTDHPSALATGAIA